VARLLMILSLVTVGRKFGLGILDS